MSAFLEAFQTAGSFGFLVYLVASLWTTRKPKN